MKNLLLTIAAVALLLLTSCQRDELQGGSISGEEVTVSISAVVPGDGGAVVKSNDNPGNGSEVNRCILEVYLLKGEYGSATASLYGTRQVVKVENLTAAFEDLNLITGQKYRLVLWADHVEDPESGLETDLYYDTESLPSISYKSGTEYEYESNDDSRDAFFKVEEFEVDGPEDRTISLTRPFGQLNVITTDYGLIPSTHLDLLPVKIKLAFPSIPTSIDLVNGTVNDMARVTTSTAVDIAGLDVDGEEDSKQLSFDYILAPAEGQTVVSKFTMSFLKDDGTTPVAKDYTFENIPVQRNYRTNVSGALLTDCTGIDIEVVPDFNDPDLDKDAELLKLMKVLEEGGNYTLQEDVEIAEALVMNGNVRATIDLNGCNIINTTSVPDSEAPQYGNTTVFELDGNAVLNIEGDGDIHAISTNPEEDGYRMAVYAKGHSTVNIYGGNFLNDQDFNDHNAQLDLIYADHSATINIYGGRFESKCANDRGYWVLNLKDGSNAAINVYGGTFVNFDPSSSMTENPVKNFVADDYSTVKVSDEPDPNGTYVVVKDGEQLNVPVEAGTPETFVQALASAAVAEISVEADMNLSTVTTEELTFTQHKTIDIASGTTIKLGDQNHFTAENGLTLTGGGIIDNSTDTPNETNPGYQKSLIHITGGDLIIDGITLVNDPDHHWHGTQYNSAAIAYWNDANVTITNARIESGEFTVCGMGRGVASGEITISDSYFESTSTNKNNGKHWAYAMRLFGSKIRLESCEVKGVQGGVSIEGCKDAEIISGKYYTVNTPGNIDGYYPLYVTNDAVVVVSGGEFLAANDRSEGLDIGGTSAVVSDDNDVNLPYGCVILKGGKFSGKAYNDVTREVYQPAEGYVYKETGDDEYPWEVVTE